METNATEEAPKEVICSFPYLSTYIIACFHKYSVPYLLLLAQTALYHVTVLYRCVTLLLQKASTPRGTPKKAAGTSATSDSTESVHKTPPSKKRKEDAMSPKQLKELSRLLS